MPRRASLALVGAAAAVALLILTWYLAFHVGVFHRADTRILAGFTDLHRPREDPIANFIAGLCNPEEYVFLVAGVLLLALARRRPGAALTIAIIVLGANVTTQLLKPLLAQYRSVLPGQAPIATVSWPSGHATAAMSLSLCLVLAAPARLRPVAAAVGAAFAVAVSYSFLTLGWHYPSDVFGGFLVAMTWTLLGVAALFFVRARRSGTPTVDLAERQSWRAALGVPAAAVGVALALVGLVLLVRPHEVVSYAQAHRTFLIGAAAIAAMGVGLATGLMLALRR
jgi:membrane-associated phospholipid phosphatase